MLILTTSAKTFDFTSPFHSPFQTQPSYLNDAAELVEALKKNSKSDLESLMNVSAEIAEVNVERYKVWDIKHTHENSRPAIVAYAGDIYRQIHENEYTEQQTEYLQHSLRILSGLYGIVRPYDLIQPYRLEMKILVKTSRGKNLYEFWGDKITQYLNRHIKANNDDFIINLASDEYASVIDPKKLSVPLINIIFNQQKGETTSNIGFLSKKARGMMIDFMVKNRIYDVAQLETFDVSGYAFVAKTPNTLLFTKQI